MPVAFKDYYQTLGVSSKATEDEIKKAFRTLARKYHPDVAKDKKAAEEKFKEINEAYEVLGNAENRRKYDELGANWKHGAPPNAQGYGGSAPRSGYRRPPGGEEYEFQFEGTGFSDFFERFFGQRGAPGFDGAGHGEDFQSGPARGHDIEGDLLITMDEALRGAMRSISVRRTNARTGQEEAQVHQVRIPAGVQAGQRIRIPGKGGEGLGGGGAGDIYLRVRYAEHPDFQARGADLLGHLNLAPWEAVLGATVPVPTLEGSVSLKVPPGTQQGHQLRIRGKGLPAGSGQRGDIYVAVAIQVPSEISKAQEQLWKQLAASSDFDPRHAS